MEKTINRKQIIIFVILFVSVGIGINRGILLWASGGFSTAQVSSWWCELQMSQDSKWCKDKESARLCEIVCSGDDYMEFEECLAYCLEQLE